jgi:hypothetical protein
VPEIDLLFRSLSALCSSQHDTAIKLLTADAGKDAKSVNVLLCYLHANEAKLATLQTALAPFVSHVTPVQQLRQDCNTQLVIKTYKIAPGELQLAFPHLSDSSAATAGASAEPKQDVSLQYPSQDPLLLAVIGRISHKI